MARLQLPKSCGAGSGDARRREHSSAAEAISFFKHLISPPFPPAITCCSRWTTWSLSTPTSRLYLARSLSENPARSREQSERNRHIMFYAKRLPGLPS